MEFNLIKDIIIIFGLSITVVFVFQKINVPSIIGFLLTGVFAGPYGLKLITSHNEVELLAEIGVILLPVTHIQIAKTLTAYHQTH